MIDPSPELPDDTLIESVELPPKVKHTLVTAGLEPVGDIRETPDSEILQIQISGRILSLFCAQPWDCRPPLECAATSFRSRQRAKIEVAATPFRHPTMRRSGATLLQDERFLAAGKPKEDKVVVLRGK
jgi:hypothetical protein